MLDQKKFWTGLLIVSLLLLFIFYKMSEILWPFLFAFIFAYLLNPVIERLIKRGIKKSYSIWGVFIGFSIIFLTASFFLFSAIRFEVQMVQSKIPAYVDFFQKEAIPYLEETFHIKLQRTTQEYLKSVIEKLLNLSPGVAESITSLVTQAFFKTFNFLVYLVDILLIPVAAVYFLYDFDRIKRKSLELLPEFYRAPFLGHLQKIDHILSGFIGGELLISLILSILYTIGLSFIGLDLSVVLGFLSGFINIIPYIGVLTGGIISILFAVVKFHDALHPLLVLGLFVTGHILDGYFLGPRMVGQKIGLHPLVVILALLIGGQYFGLLGLLFSVPLAAIFNYILRMGFEAYRNSKFYLAKPKS